MNEMLFPDAPVDGTSNKKDRLHRAEYAKRIASRLSMVSDEGSLVAALEGKWGSGKTSVFEMICRHFQESDSKGRPIIVRFNPWMFSGLDNLVQQFLIQFGAAIGVGEAGGVKLRRVGDELVKYSALFDVLKFVPGAEPWASLVKGVMNTSGNAAKEIGVLKELSLEKQKDRVVEAIRKSKASFLVIVDDVDRLAPNEVHAMLQLVKVVSNFPRVNYLLAYDQETIEKALEGVQIPNPRGYLEKIVQLRLPMPRMSAQDGTALLNHFLKEFGNESVELFEEHDSESWGVFAHQYIIPLLRTPRDFVRLANRLLINYSLVKGEISFKEYCALEVIAVVEPALYDHVKSNPVYYIGSDPQDVLSYGGEKKERAAKERANKLDEVDDSAYRGKLLRTLNRLFPYSVGSRDYSSSRRSGRLCNPENFEFAFYFSRPATLVSLMDLREIWVAPNERWGLLSRYASSETGKALLDLIGDAVGDEYSVGWGLPEDVEGFLSDYAKFVEHPGLPEESCDFFDLGYSGRLTFITDRLLSKLDKKSRVQLAKRLCGKSDALCLSAFIILNQFWATRKGKEDRLLFADSEFKGVQDVWRKTVLLALGGSKIWYSKQLRYIMMALLISGEGGSVVRCIEKRKKGSEEMYRGLEALLGSGAMNGRPYLSGPDEFTSERIDVKCLVEMMKGLNPAEGRLKAVVSCYRSPGGKFFLDSGERVK